MKTEKTIGYYVIVFIITIFSLIMLLPLIWMLLSAFKTQGELLRMPPTFLPEHFNFDNFIKVFEAMPFLRYYANSVGTSIINTGVGALSSALFGYVFAKYKFPGRDIIFWVILACMMIPYETLMIPLYKTMVRFGWNNTYLVLTIPYFVNIFGIFLMRQSFFDLPDDYLEAAETDGCGQLRTFWSIALPMELPTISALCIFLFMASFNSFLWPLISTDSRKLFTLPVGVASMLSDRGNQMAMLMAASTMMILPIFIVFTVAQKNFISGLSLGGIKG